MPLPCNEPRWGSPCITSYSKGYAFPSSCCEVYRSKSHQETTVIINYLALNWHKMISSLRWAPCARFFWCYDYSSLVKDDRRVSVCVQAEGWAMCSTVCIWQRSSACGQGSDLSFRLWKIRCFKNQHLKRPDKFLPLQAFQDTQPQHVCL